MRTLLHIAPVLSQEGEVSHVASEESSGISRETLPLNETLCKLIKSKSMCNSVFFAELYAVITDFFSLIVQSFLYFSCS